MSRIQKLENIYKEQLKDHQVDNVSDFIQSVVDADITKGKYSRFLIEAFLNDKFLEEDLMGGVDSTVGQAIRLFDKHKSKLPINERSVYALNSETGEALYQSPGDLWNSVKQYQGELSGKELKREEQEKIYRETEFVYKDEETGFQIVSPLTEDSAQWWGKGTRWCTSAYNNNMFWNYAKDSPLFILLIPANGEKLQLWKNIKKSQKTEYDDNIQFMDESDNSISLEYIEQNWTLLKPICLWLNDLKFIPEKYRTNEIYLNAIKQNGCNIKYIPDNLLTKELCELAVKQNGWCIKDISSNFLTKELYELAVQSNGEALYYVPKKQLTYELCKMAVKQNGEALFYTPKALKTDELYELAVQSNGNSLRIIPLKSITSELCKLAVQQKGNSLSYVPDEYRIKELYEIAIKNDGISLYYVPEKLKTPALCELAVQNDGYALQFVPEHLKTKKICELAIKQNFKAFQYTCAEGKLFLNTVNLEKPKIPEEHYKETFKDINNILSNFNNENISLNVNVL
jgi:hypothetical protein